MAELTIAFESWLDFALMSMLPSWTVTTGACSQPSLKKKIAWSSMIKFVWSVQLATSSIGTWKTFALAGLTGEHEYRVNDDI